MYPGLRKLAKNELCDFFENSCTRVYGNWAKNELCHFLKIHVPGSTEIGQKLILTFQNLCGTWSYQIFRGTWSFQILCGTKYCLRIVFCIVFCIAFCIIFCIVFVLSSEILQIFGFVFWKIKGIKN